MIETSLLNGKQNGEAATFAQLLDQYEYPEPERGQILTGEILEIADGRVILDVGSKRDAVVPYEEVSELGEDLIEELSRGDEILVYVTRTPRGSEDLFVSIEKGLAEQDWKRAETIMADGEVVELKVVGQNRGGLLVEFGRLQGFVPNSHIPDVRYINNPQQRGMKKAEKVDDTLALKIIELNRRKERLVLSATAAQAEQRVKRLKALQPEEVITGRVKHIVKYGAFIDLGGVDGLLHISKIAWQHVDHPADVLSVGDEIEVLIEDVDVERERVTLNHKVLLPSPWELFAEEHTDGELIEGVVSNLVDFGAFVEVAPGIEGLIHISEISHTHVEHPSDVLQPGDHVLMRIISLEPGRERLGLSLRRVTAAEEMAWMRDRNLEQVA